MKQHEIYQLRRVFLSQNDHGGLDPNSRACMIILEAFDWITKSKAVKHQRHYNSWLGNLATTYDIDVKYLREAMQFMIDAEFIVRLEDPAQQITLFSIGGTPE